MKVLYVVTEDWYFCSHRLPLAIAARQRGDEVLVATRVQQHGELIKNHDLRLIPLRLRRRSGNPFGELSAISQIRRLYWHEKPDIVHHVSLKPVLYGSIAALLSGRVIVVNALAGLGFVFASEKPLARLLRPVIKIAFRLLFNRQRTAVIVQNPDDRKLLLQAVAVKPEQVHLIRGSGVNTVQFSVLPEPDGEVVVAMVSRMLWDKGIAEYIEAVRLLKEKKIRFRALLVGQPDDENPAAVSKEQLQLWHQRGDIEWLGHSDNIAGIWQQSHIAVLPSYYGEGVPKSLLEAASCARAIVTTDMPGCREIVKNNVNGLLVPARNAKVLATAMAKLIEDPDLRQTMGRKGREKVEQEFSEQQVLTETLALYDQLMQ